MSAPARQSQRVDEFDEKQFYLDEFRGRTLVFALPGDALNETDFERFAGIVRQLLTNDTRVLVLLATAQAGLGEQQVRRWQRKLGAFIFREETIPLFQRRGRSTAFVHVEPHAFDPPAHSGTVLANMWAAFRRGPLVVGIVPGVTHAQALAVAECISTRLRVHKLVLIEPEGGIASRDGTAISFMDDATLSALLQAGEAEWTGLAARRATFEAVRAALRGGVGSVNLCALEGLARELFTYAGSGTLFTMADYCTVARLGIDDFEEVERLIERGQREGVLKLRTAEEVAAMLVNGYGATIGMHHLAGICALLTEPYRADNAGEVVGLYAITRFKGEGIGARLLARIVDDARSAALSYLFACTTEDRAQLFFERAGFRRVDAAAVPAEKWAGYDAARKPVVAVFRLDLGATPKAHMP